MHSILCHFRRPFELNQTNNADSLSWRSDVTLLSLATFVLFSADFHQLKIPEDLKCNLNELGTIRTSIPTICGPNYIGYYHLTCVSHIRHLGFKGKGKLYLSTRLNRHPKTVASFQLTRLALSGDVCPNPGPVTNARNINKPKCNTCEKTVARNHRVVRCQRCQFLSHQMRRLNTERLPSV